MGKQPGKTIYRTGISFPSKAYYDRARKHARSRGKSTFAEYIRYLIDEDMKKHGRELTFEELIKDEIKRQIETYGRELTDEDREPPERID